MLCSSPAVGNQTNTILCCKPKTTRKLCILASPTRHVSGFSSTRAVLPLQHAPHTPHEDWISLRITEAIINTPKIVGRKEVGWLFNPPEPCTRCLVATLRPPPQPRQSLRGHEQRNVLVCLFSCGDCLSRRCRAFKLGPVTQFPTPFPNVG